MNSDIDENRKSEQMQFDLIDNDIDYTPQRRNQLLNSKHYPSKMGSSTSPGSGVNSSSGGKKTPN